MPEETKYYIPQFREKAMYIKYINPYGQDMENSYSVQSSFKGILRLSPNNYNTLYETDTVQLSDKELAAKENIAFRDSISHLIELPYCESGVDGEAGKDVEGSIIDDSGDRQFLAVTESEGYQLDLRIASSSIEAGNLYVRGMVETEQLIINANQLKTPLAQTSSPLLINNVGLPAYPDTDNYTTTYKNSNITNPVVAPGITNDIVKDELEEDIIDKSAILVTKSGQDGNAILTYKNSTELINDLVLEALMSMESVPTGSIHYFPVTIEQYKQLKGIHNRKYYDNATVNTGDNDGSYDQGGESDPLIRDYLLCDGSCYYTKDFPELAKILRGTKIYYDRLGEKNYYERVLRRGYNKC